MRTVLGIIVLVLALASCRNQAPASSSQSRLPAVAAAVPTASPEWLPALDGEGLRVFNSHTGASRLIALGADAKQSMDTLGRVLGEAPPAPVA